MYCECCYAYCGISVQQEQVEKMKKDQERLEKQLAETQTENRKLQDPLQKVGRER